MRSLSALPTSLAVLVAASTLASAAAGTTETLPSGLIIEHVSGPVVCDRPTRRKDRLAIHYKGFLTDGTEFDESYKRGRPFVFTLDNGDVIGGWDQGLQDMCIGQSRKLTIPPELGYGDRGTGPIPGGATLVFETKLVDIVKLSTEPDPAKAKTTETATASTSATEEGSLSIATAPPTPPQEEEQDSELELPEAQPTTAHGEPSDGPPPQARCHLLGPFALIVQGALGTLALLTLVWKRWREVPKRPWKIFFFDVSKQVFGSALTHVINLAMSMLGSAGIGNIVANAAATAAVKEAASGDGKGKFPNPCSFYVLNLGIDTTIGVPVLYFLLKILYHLFLRTPLARPRESIKSGHYGTPPKTTWYLKQLFIYYIGLMFMKLFVLFLFLAMPWLPWVGDWALRWTEGNEALQITFALFIFPLAMNAAQYWVIDNFIMEKQKGGNGKGYQAVNGEEEDEERQRMIDDDETLAAEDDEQGKGDGGTAQQIKEIEPMPIPAYLDGNGEGSRRGSPK